LSIYISVRRALCVFRSISFHPHTRQAVAILLCINDDYSKGDDSYGAFATPGYPAAVEAHMRPPLLSVHWNSNF
jgi:hypothetical protein